MPLLTTAYFPPIDYMSAVVSCKSIQVEACETYAKQSWRNRCVVATASGAMALTVPVVKVNGSRTQTGDVVISYAEKWQQLHWRAIQSAYSNSPYFEYYRDAFEPFFHQPYEKLLDMNLAILEALFKVLKIKVDIQTTAAFEKTPIGITDLREAFGPKKLIRQELFTPYYQVFADRNGFLPNLSILDLIFCEGPNAYAYLEQFALRRCDVNPPKT